MKTKITCIEDEIDLNWKEYPEGNERFLAACRGGYIKGIVPISDINPHCGCAYGHISGLNEKQAWLLINERRYQYNMLEDELTPLEQIVIKIKPGENVTQNERLQALHDLILARKPV